MEEEHRDTGPASDGPEAAAAPPLSLEAQPPEAGELEAKGAASQSSPPPLPVGEGGGEGDQAFERAQAELQGELAAVQARLDEAQRAGLAHLRRALLAEHAGQVVPELVAGSTPEELEASLALARAAYQRAAETARQELASQQVPVGNVSHQEAELEVLNPLDKIARGLQR